MSNYEPAADRYEARSDGWFRRAGRSGLRLSAVSLGLWHNFGDPGTSSAKHDEESSMHANARDIVFTAFDRGITHFDLANNYGPKPGSAESRFGRILADDLASHRDELIISTKAGYGMWPGPYGSLGSRKSLLASLDQSLGRMGLEYVDIFYIHRPDFETPLQETMGALDQAVRSGKALYVAMSNFSATMTAEAVSVVERDRLARPVLHQPRYNMFDRWVEQGTRPGDSLLDTCGRHGIGVIPFSPLDQGMLTDKYLDGIPDDSRAASKDGALSRDAVNAAKVAKAEELQKIAADRGQTLAQLAIAWCLRDERVTSVIIGASRSSQVTDCSSCLEAGALTSDEVTRIGKILDGPAS
jgi:L-glyceraldehyde 3-phosphate reductase